MNNLTRRGALRLSGLAAGAASLASGTDQSAAAGGGGANTNSYFAALKPYYPGKQTLAAEDMRITFLGTWFAPRLAQACNSVLVELGNGDCFVFDCGAGVLAKYNAMGIPQSKLDKIFLTHLHLDHCSDLSQLYGFGTSYGRFKPLNVWGPRKSNIPEPGTGTIFDDGTKAYCKHIQEAFRWHTESQSLLPSTVIGYVPPDWGGPALDSEYAGKASSYDMIPHELDWQTEGGIAYEYNDVKITHFPAVHNRAGSISYKLEWKGLSMIFTGDTKPNHYLIRAANDGVDVLIHEMTTPPEVWCEKMMGLKEGDPTWAASLAWQKVVQESSHTVQKAFGYVLSQIAKPPRLAVGTHFPAADDTIRPALADIRSWYPKANGEVAIASDLMVLLVSKTAIRQRRAVVSEFTWPHIVASPAGAVAPAKYLTPTEQLDRTQLADSIDSSTYDPK